MKKRNQIIVGVITAAAVAALFIGIVPLLDSQTGLKGEQADGVAYNVIYENYNSSVLYTAKIKNGENITYPYEAPTKVIGNDSTKYVFMGWDVLKPGEKEDGKYDIGLKDSLTVDTNYVLKAVYSATIDYTVKFVNFDDTSISSKSIEIGSPLVAPADPTRAADATYTYTFVGWDIDGDGAADTLPATVLSDITAKAVYTSTFIDYTVIFKSEGVELDKKEHEHYNSAIVAPADPIKAATNTYKYTFAGWDADGDGNADTLPARVTGNMTFTAVFTEEYINYTVKFLNYDDAVLSSNLSAHYGDAITAPAASKPADSTYTYALSGWDIDGDGNVDTLPATVDSDLIAKAIYASTYVDYTVTFKNYDDSVITSKNTAHYGDTITIPTETVTPVNDAEFTYTFAGWDTDGDGDFDSDDSVPSTVEGDLTAKAIYNKTKNQYTIDFLDVGGNIIKSETKDYGTIIDTLKPSTNPTKPKDLTYKYTFDGWDLDGDGVKDALNVALVEDVTATPIFTSQYIDYEVTWLNGDMPLTAEYYHYGDVLPASDEPATPVKASDVYGTYTFDGWDIDNDGVKDTLPTTITQNYTMRAVFVLTYRNYTITWENYDGSPLGSDTGRYIDTVTPPTATKPADLTYTYDLVGWDDNGDGIEDADALVFDANKTVTAVFASQYIDYSVQIMYNDGVQPAETLSKHYNDTVTLPSTVTKAADAQYTYTFDGWDTTSDGAVDLAAGTTSYTVTEDVVISAIFSSTVNAYDVNYLDEDGNVLQNTTVNYGDPVGSYSGIIPTKITSDQSSFYLFDTWDTLDSELVTGDTNISPIFKTDEIKYEDILQVGISGTSGHYSAGTDNGLKPEAVTAGVVPPNIIIGGYATAPDSTMVPITSLYNSAFKQNSFIETVYIKNTIALFGSYVFQGCSNLKSIKFEEPINPALTAIGVSFANNCPKLTEVHIPDGITTINTKAFTNDTALDSVVIPASVTTVGGGAFSACSPTLKVFLEGADGCDATFPSGWKGTTGTSYYLDSTGTNNDGHHWWYVDGVPTIIV